MTWLRIRWRMLRFWWCVKRGHVLGISGIAIGFYEPDRLLPDGTIEPGTSYESGPTCCLTCGYRSI